MCSLTKLTHLKKKKERDREKQSEIMLLLRLSNAPHHSASRADGNLPVSNCGVELFGV